MDVRDLAEQVRTSLAKATPRSHADAARAMKVLHRELQRELDRKGAVQDPGCHVRTVLTKCVLLCASGQQVGEVGELADAAMPLLLILIGMLADADEAGNDAAAVVAAWLQQNAWAFATCSATAAGAPYVAADAAAAAAVRAAKELAEQTDLSADLVRHVAKKAVVCFAWFHVRRAQGELLATLQTFARTSGPNKLAASQALSPTDSAAALVAACSGDSGQVAIRDLAMSFLLPVQTLGRRSTLLLPRQQHTEATRDFSHIVNYAHHLAMRGSENAWRQTSDGPPKRAPDKAPDKAGPAAEAEPAIEFQGLPQLEQTCVLLAGLAMLLSPRESDARFAAAFDGVVQLPFLAVAPSSRGSCRLFLLESQTWVLAAPAGRETGPMRTVHRGSGVAGLHTCAGLLMQMLKL